LILTCLSAEGPSSERTTWKTREVAKEYYSKGLVQYVPTNRLPERYTSLKGKVGTKWNRVELCGGGRCGDSNGLGQRMTGDNHLPEVKLLGGYREGSLSEERLCGKKRGRKEATDPGQHWTDEQE